MSLYLHNGIIWHMISESWLSEGVGQNKVFEIKKKTAAMRLFKRNRTRTRIHLAAVLKIFYYLHTILTSNLFRLKQRAKRLFYS